MKTITTMKGLKAIVAAGDGLYVRWSRGPALDRKQATSRDYVYGGEHAGLSAVPVNIDWACDEVWMSRRVTEYLFLRLKDSRINCWIYSGKTIGKDSDNYDSITDIEPVGRLSNALVQTLYAIKQ